MKNDQDGRNQSEGEVSSLTTPRHRLLNLANKVVDPLAGKAIIRQKFLKILGGVLHSLEQLGPLVPKLVAEVVQSLLVEAQLGQFVGEVRLTFVTARNLK